MKTKIVVDASYVLDLLFPDEKKTTAKQNGLVAPKLLTYEVANAIKMAVSRKRITKVVAGQLIREFESWRVELRDVELSEVLALAIKEGLSVYDASYAWLAIQLKLPLLTWDAQLKRVVGG